MFPVMATPPFAGLSGLSQTSVQLQCHGINNSVIVQSQEEYMRCITCISSYLVLAHNASYFIHIVLRKAITARRFRQHQTFPSMMVHS